MMNQSNASGFSQLQINALLKLAGKRMNVDPQTLRRQLEAGNVAQVMQQLGGDQAAQVNQMLQNPQELQKLIQSPQIAKMIQQMTQQNG